MRNLRLDASWHAYKVESEMTEQALAWRVELRNTENPTTWRFYATYNSEKAAMAMVSRCAGPPLEFRVIPLYAQPKKPPFSAPN